MEIQVGVLVAVQLGDSADQNLFTMAFLAIVVQPELLCI